MLRYSVVGPVVGLFVSLLLPAGRAQDASFPLEAVKISGSQVSSPVVMRMADLKLGQPINKKGIEDACQKLGQSGIFETVSFAYAPGPKKGYVVTLQLTDPVKMVDASIDVAGVDEKTLWTWISGQFPSFNGRVPQSDEAQQYLAHLLEQKLGDTLHGEHVVTRLEQDLMRGRQVLSFQPEHLPQIAVLNFNGAQQVPADDLRALLLKLLDGQGYLDRHFRQLVEEAVRQEYWRNGCYKVQFPKIEAQFTNPSTVSVTTTVIEGLQYKLADVQISGDDLPVEAMLKAAKFKKAAVANWTEIQQGVWAAEVPVKRTGYMEAVAVPERVFDDATQGLILKLSVRKGPLYHFGQVSFPGLSPDLADKARKSWAMVTGAPFDFQYDREFLKNFYNVADLKKFKIQTKIEPAPGDHVRNFVVSFMDK